MKSQYLTIKGTGLDPGDFYRKQEMSYPKFFKMDLLCKWVLIAADKLLKDVTFKDPDNTAIILQTRNGCIEADKKYLASLADIPSPGLFVYTLPNIALGELSIRYKMKGEQICLISACFDADEIAFNIKTLSQVKNKQILIIYADVYADDFEIFMILYSGNETLSGGEIATLRASNNNFVTINNLSQ